MAVTSLGTTADGRVFTYDASLYEFYLDGGSAAFADVQMLDSRNWIRWRAPELRDWFVHIDAAALYSCNRRARAQRAAASEPMSRFRDMAGSRMAQLLYRVDESYFKASQAASCQSPDTLVYRSDNEAVASVDPEGNVRVNGEGTASIFAHRERANSVGAEVRLVRIEVPHFSDRY